MKKISALILLIAGLFCVFFSGWKILKSQHSQVLALQQARELTPIKFLEKPGINRTTQSVDKHVLGILEVPTLNAELPIVEGTTDEQLKKGVGHFSKSALPGGNDQIVLSGHRDTVFRRFGELKEGDPLIVTYQGEIFTYIVERTKVVDAEDRTIIHSTAPKEELVLTTCYPFHFIGNAPNRYIIYAYPKTT
ncbi:class D sortase [Heyndrickxia sporothermodurans]|uniref:class D sortase n=1 Tax=Heyndrickxia sporothermodurans TaxID=46224 RepID=UPI002E2340E3|nr:class D sortase [Heyndrickxia sporothermodurans]